MPVPSILIGFGAFGLSALRSFLASAATRGALAWDDDVVVGSVNERALKSLSLFWVPDSMGVLHQRPNEGLPTDDGYELMDDLFHQIQMLHGTFTQICTELTEIVGAARTRLLEAGRHGERGMPQLDVIVIGQPTSPEMIGLIRNLTEPAIANLAADPSFQTAQSRSLLNFIQIFDFEDYWNPEMDEVRMALRRMIDEGNHPTREASFTAGLTYLFDGNTPAGRRTASSRQQEVVLFLQFLLLENIRSSPDSRIFFEPSQGSAVCSIGIRVVERSSGSLRRLAAAAFAHGWLEHMVSGERFDPHNSAFEEIISSWRSEHLASIIGESELKAAALAEIASIEKTLLDLAPPELDYASSLDDLASRQTEAAILRLSRLSAGQSLRLSGEDLKDFREKVDQAITVALQERSPALTLGAVIDELAHFEEEFTQAAIAAAPEPSPQTTLNASPFGEAAAMRQEYDRYLGRQVQVAALKVQWWPRAAILFAEAFTPVLLAGLASGPLGAVRSPWIVATAAAVILGLLFWLFGSTLLHPALTVTAERGRDFYTDPDRGRIAERIRRAVHSPAVAGKITAYADLLVAGLKQYALSALTEEFRQARQTLIERRGEIHWLRAQVREFLRSNQVDDRDFPPVFQENRIASDVRFSLEQDEDLAQVAATLPRDPGRFREQVSIRRLFHFWSMPFCPTFLHPLQFLDELSKSFTDRSEVEQTDIRRRALRIKNFLANELRMSVCFKWLVTDGLPPVSKGMLIPVAWAGLEGVDTALRNAGFSQHPITTENPERLYVYEYQVGIPAALLVRPALQGQGAPR